MTIRAASPADRDLLLTLVKEFEDLLPELPYEEESLEDDWRKLEQRMRDGVVALAEEDGNALGFTSADFGKDGPHTVFVVDLYVREAARRRGVAKALLAHVAETARERGCTHLLLEVDSRNVDALAVYRRLGFEEASKTLRKELTALAARVAPRGGESYGAVHVQTDNARAVERAVAQYGPRLGRNEGLHVEAGPAWTVVRDDRFDKDVHRKLARELSDRTGAVVIALSVEEDAVVRFVVLERGRVVDEYLSVPEYYGALPPGEVLALRANPTLVGRLTGADPARVRAAARTADTVDELPPAGDLYRQIAGVLGLAT